MQEMQETWFQSLGQENPLEREMTTHSSILDWRIPWTEEPGGLPSTTEWLSTTLLVKNRKETQHEETGFSSPTSSGALPFYIYSTTLIVGTFWASQQTDPLNWLGKALTPLWLHMFPLHETRLSRGYIQKECSCHLLKCQAQNNVGLLRRP